MIFAGQPNLIVSWGKNLFALNEWSPSWKELNIFIWAVFLHEGCPILSSRIQSKLHLNDRWSFDWNVLVYDEMENISMDETSIQVFFKFKKTEPAEIS